MITMILSISFLQLTLAAPLQMLHPIQDITNQKLLLPPQKPINQQDVSLLQQLHRIYQQMPLQGEIQQVPLLQPLQGTVQQQRLALEEQIFALQQFQALQRINLGPSPMSMNTPPILVLFPNSEPDMQQKDFTTNNLKHHKPEEMGDDDSEIIDADSIEKSYVSNNPIRAVLLMPNTRGFIGDIISYIPFLPIEINVPDSISWIYNGIAGIISVIGQSLPFRPQTPNSMTRNEENNMLSIWNKIKTNQQMPIIMIPLGH